MRKPMDMTAWALLAVLALGSIHPLQAAKTQTCRLELSEAESRWARIRDRMPVGESFEQKVTSLLLKAVELRHQAEIKGCLSAVNEAKAEMDRWEVGHASTPAKQR
ncbi:MAG: hypothetical protein OEO83_17330 [Alphaproteobacteria bacterium]|nr:hypothetical protein [Alphaproteobacteria bacterium]